MSTKEKEEYRTVQEIRDAFIANPDIIRSLDVEEEQDNLDHFSSKIVDLLDSELPKREKS